MTHAAGSLVRPVSEQDHAVGRADAPVTLVEYGDFECPHCGHAYPIVEELRKNLGDQLRFVFRHFPITEIHEHAELAAESAEAAGVQGRFWEMHAALFTHQSRLDGVHIRRYAEQIGLDTEQFSQMVNTRACQQRVRDDFMSGVRSGVNGTPTFFINGHRYDGMPELAPMTQAIQMAMR